MSYQVLSRKWRPQRFDEIVGQVHITRTLQNAISMDRVAHGYLFSGSRGVGKTTTARILAKALSCKNIQENNPCNTCITCKEITQGSSLDIQELDGASNRGIDEIRGLREAVKYPPNISPYRIYIIDEVHMLTREAFNALLKTLEEPPPHVIFIMATTDAHKVPTTILSRTQKFDFKPIAINPMSEYLKSILHKENISYEDEAIHLIAQKADGSLRDSLSLLDQVIAYANEKLNTNTVRDVLGIIEENVFLEIFKLMNENNQQQLISYINNLLNEGFSIYNFITGFNEFTRNCMLYKNDNSKNYNLSEESITWLKNESKLKVEDILHILDLCLKFESNLKNTLQPQISLEAIFMKLAMRNASVDIAPLASRGENETPVIENTQPVIETKHVEEKEPKDIETIENNVEPKKVETETSNETANIASNENAEKKQLLTLDIIKESWGNIITELEKINSKIAHFLEDVILTEYNDSKLFLELASGNKFQLTALEKDIHQIETVIFNILNEKIKLSFQLQKEPETGEKEKKTKNTEHPLFEKVIETFDGEIIR